MKTAVVGLGKADVRGDVLSCNTYNAARVNRSSMKLIFESKRTKTIHESGDFCFFHVK